MTSTTTTLDAAYLERWQHARAEREQQRRDPLAYIGYAGLHRLTAEPQRFAGIPGRWSTGDDGPRVHLDDDERITVSGVVSTGEHVFAPVREREFRRAAEHGDIVLELSKRGGHDLLRPIDPALGRQVAAAYDHTPAWEPDERWILEGRFEPFPELRPAQVGATVGDIVHTHSSVGEVVAIIGDVEHRLLVIVPDTSVAGAAGTGSILFTDATSGHTTDPLGRSVPVEHPATAGPVVIDFNYTRNLQRPYTPFAPCPLPPTENRIAAAVEAGEQLPRFAD